MKTHITLLLVNIFITLGAIANNLTPSLTLSPENGKVLVELNVGFAQFDKVIISRTKKNYVFEQIAEINGGQTSILFIDENPTEGIGYYKVEFKNDSGALTFSLSKGIYVPFKEGVFVNVHDYNLKDGELILSFLNLIEGKVYPINIIFSDNNGRVISRKKYKIHCHNCIKRFEVESGQQYANVTITNKRGVIIHTQDLNN